ncbi:Asp23/Gls24 family envelope stress response protein [Candidatus Atribacteria bacterium 1244-E10-H5-B2]|nr:MAG: Asp23/Gls24 family envelope stress response protein [Candidatus Atribacteria bacterium 1244-E10-H5-B2]
MSDKQVVKGNPQEQELGNIAVSKDVVAVIAALETIKIRGVVGITSGHRGKSPNILSRKDLAKGVEVWMKPGEAAITIPIVTAYEVGIFKVAEEVQRRVKDAICSMTGLKVLKVDVNVQGIKFKEEKKKIQKETQKEIRKETKK